MPEIQYLSALVTILRGRHQRITSGDDRPADAGDIVQYVVITAALAIAAVAIVAIIVAKIMSKATSLQTE
ncbi:MAG: hypothetical protein ACT4P1_10715 [Sporichthyaceae bacterium]